MLLEIGVMLLVDAALLWGAWWCWRRPQRTAMSRWLRLQAFLPIGFVLVGFAAFADRENRYSYALGFVTGQAVVLYVIATAVITALRSQSSIVAGPPSSTTRTSGPAELFVNATHNPLEFFYPKVTPTIAVNGEKYRLPWGTHRFDVPADDCEVSVSYPWVFSPECGKNTVRFKAEAGKRRTVTYYARFIRYVPGKIRVE